MLYRTYVFPCLEENSSCSLQLGMSRLQCPTATGDTLEVILLIHISLSVCLLFDFVAFGEKKKRQCGIIYPTDHHCFCLFSLMKEELVLCAVLRINLSFCTIRVPCSPHAIQLS